MQLYVTHHSELNRTLNTRYCGQVVSWLHQQGGGWDSGPLASHLERLARRGELPGAWQLALDMYARLAMHDKHCQMLLAKVSAAPPPDHSCSCMVLLECCYLQLAEHPIKNQHGSEVFCTQCTHKGYCAATCGAPACLCCGPFHAHKHDGDLQWCQQRQVLPAWWRQCVTDTDGHICYLVCRPAPSQLLRVVSFVAKTWVRELHLPGAALLPECS